MHVFNREWGRRISNSSGSKGDINNGGIFTMRFLDKAMAVSLALGAVGHTFGSIKAFRDHPAQLLWALCASVLIVLVGAINLLRTSRPGDRSLACLAAFGALSWLAASLAFGAIIDNLFDIRVLIFALLSGGLLVFSVRDALAKSNA